MRDAMDRMQRIKRALSALRLFPAADEYELHESIAAALNGSGFVVAKEAKIGPRCRVDLLVDGIAIEVKRGKPPRGQLMRQCGRYLACDGVDGLILVTQTSVNLPGQIGGKPVLVVSLNRLWGLALP